MGVLTLRFARVAAVAAAFAFLVRASRVATQARAQGAEVPSIVAPLAVISALLLFAAIVIERVRREEEGWQRDLLWGVALGGLCAAGTMLF